MPEGMLAHRERAAGLPPDPLPDLFVSLAVGEDDEVFVRSTWRPDVRSSGASDVSGIAFPLALSNASDHPALLRDAFERGTSIRRRQRRGWPLYRSQPSSSMNSGSKSKSVSSRRARGVQLHASHFKRPHAASPSEQMICGSCSSRSSSIMHESAFVAKADTSSASCSSQMPARS